MAIGQQSLIDGNHLWDVFAGPREHGCFHDVQAGFVPVEPAGVNVGNLLDRFAFGQSGHDHLIAAGLGQFLAHVTNVGDVLDVGYLHAAVNQRAAHPVGHKVSA